MGKRSVGGGLDGDMCLGNDSRLRIKVYPMRLLVEVHRESVVSLLCL